MTLRALAAGVLTSDPAQRQTTRGASFATGSLRTSEGDAVVFVSITAFGDLSEQLLQFKKGDSLAVGGRVKLTEWTGRDGVERHGLSIACDQLAAAAPPKRHTAGNGARSDRPRPPIQGGPTPEIPNDGVTDLWTGP